MSTSPILTRGFGTFGGLRYLPTLGFGTSSAITSPFSVFLQGAVQRSATLSGVSQRSALCTGAAQRNVGLTGNVGAN